MPSVPLSSLLFCYFRNRFSEGQGRLPRKKDAWFRVSLKLRTLAISGSLQAIASVVAIS